ncbi:hypothetical protein ACH4EC_31855 [Streptomyces anulatus]
MAEEGAILAPTCEEMAQALKHERERMGRSIEQLRAAHSLLGSIIHAGEAITGGRRARAARSGGHPAESPAPGRSAPSALSRYARNSPPVRR